jgi:acyl-CoA thioesterase-1
MDFELNGEMIQRETSNDSLKTILFFGDSLTAGYGVNQDEAFPAIIQCRIDSLKLPYEVVNAGLSGETSAGGLRRIDWVLQRPVDIFVLELGSNDGLRGIDLNSTRRNLQAILDKVRIKYPNAQLVVVGMHMPPNFGPDYTKMFRELFPKLAEVNRAELIPFLLKGVVLVPDEERLFRSNHPTAEGHKILAENVWEVINPLIGGIQ